MSSEKDMIIRYSFAEMLKENVMDFMDILLRYEDYSNSKRTEPNNMLLIEWIFEKLLKNMALAANIGKGKHFQEAELILEEAREKYNYSISSFKEVISKLRDALTKITTEGARAAEKLF